MHGSIVSSNFEENQWRVGILQQRGKTEKWEKVVYTSQEDSLFNACTRGTGAEGRWRLSRASDPTRPASIKSAWPRLSCLSCVLTGALSSPLSEHFYALTWTALKVSSRDFETAANQEPLDYTKRLLDFVARVRT